MPIELRNLSVGPESETLDDALAQCWFFHPSPHIWICQQIIKSKERTSCSRNLSQQNWPKYQLWWNNNLYLRFLENLNRISTWWNFFMESRACKKVVPAARKMNFWFWWREKLVQGMIFVLYDGVECLLHLNERQVGGNLSWPWLGDVFVHQCWWIPPRCSAYNISRQEWMEWLHEVKFLWYRHHHHRFDVHFLPRLIKGMDSCFPTTLGRHFDASISRKSHLVTIRPLSIPGKVGVRIW